MNFIEAHKLRVSFFVFLFSLLPGWQTQVLSQGTIVDHSCTDIAKIPESAINQAKTTKYLKALEN